jgi:hypothetical protein
MHGLTSTGVTEYWQAPLSPDCRIVNVRVATVMPLRRSPVSLFLDTAYVTSPLPTRSAFEVTVTHDALLTVVHAHPAAVVTANVPMLASFEKSAPAGAMS